MGRGTKWHNFKYRSEQDQALHSLNAAPQALTEEEDDDDDDSTTTSIALASVRSGIY